MKTVADRIRFVRENLLGLNKNKFAETLDFPNIYITRWERGDVEPKADFYERLKGKFKSINTDWIISGNGNPEIDNNIVADVKSHYSPVNPIPVYKNIPCGLPAEIFSDEATEFIWVKESKADHIAVEAKGHSNMPLIRDKDIIVAKQVQKPKNRDIVVTNFKSSPEFLNGNIKLFQRLSDKEFLLIPINTEYPTERHFYNEVYSFYKCIRLIRNLY